MTLKENISLALRAISAGGTVTIDDATIANALIGLLVENNGGGESFFEVKNATFCNNEIGIQVQPFTTAGAITSYIEDTYFTAPSLISPKSGEVGDYGIVIIHPKYNYPKLTTCINYLF